MPTNPTTSTATQRWARLVRLALRAQRAADDLLACPMGEAEAEVLLAQASVHVRALSDRLEDALYHLESCIDARPWAVDVQIARACVQAREELDLVA